MSEIRIQGLHMPIIIVHLHFRRPASHLYVFATPQTSAINSFEGIWVYYVSINVLEHHKVQLRQEIHPPRLVLDRTSESVPEPSCRNKAFKSPTEWFSGY